MKEKQHLKAPFVDLDLLNLHPEAMRPFSLLHYVFMTRQYDYFIENYKEKIDYLATEESFNTHQKEAGRFLNELFQSRDQMIIPPIVALLWSRSFFESFLVKNYPEYLALFKQLLDKVPLFYPLETYDDQFKILDSKLSAFEYFFKDGSPLLNIKNYPKQRLASKQVFSDQRFSLVTDEVGTGKTVTGLYCIDELINRSDRVTNTLIICPYNKREDWKEDIARQLGRYAHVVSQKDDGLIYHEDLKNAYFRINEHEIFISGHGQSEKDKNGKNSALKEELNSWAFDQKWDLIIIDEAHLSFENYDLLKADRLLMLTATPIVVTAAYSRTMEDYIKLAEKILDKNLSDYEINPLKTRIPTEQDIFTNWFREDYKESPLEREILFISCKRSPYREELFEKLQEKNSYLGALNYDQEDTYLFKVYRDQFPYDKSHYIPRNSEKQAKLLEFIETEAANIADVADEKTPKNLAYIVFCEHVEVVQGLYQYLKDNLRGFYIAAKTGKREDIFPSIEADEEIDFLSTLVSKIDEGSNVLLITTGKTAGTGLNLGSFDGVIHYELPYTSIELEQRFGRIDRINNSRKKAKKMVFLLNEAPEGRADTEVNRMLYYCSSKITEAAKVMPVRNTVLFYPEFIARNTEAMINSLTILEEEDRKLQSLRQEEEQLTNQYRELRTNVLDALDLRGADFRSRNLLAREVERQIDENRERGIHLIEEKPVLNDFLLVSGKIETLRTQIRKIREKIRLEIKSIEDWISVIGIENLDEANFQDFISDVTDEPKIEQLSLPEIDEILSETDDDTERNKFSEDVTRLRNELLTIQKNYLDHHLTSNGIFYYDANKKRIVRTDVESFRGK